MVKVSTVVTFGLLAGAWATVAVSSAAGGVERQGAEVEACFIREAQIFLACTENIVDWFLTCKNGDEPFHSVVTPNAKAIGIIRPNCDFDKIWIKCGNNNDDADPCPKDASATFECGESVVIEPCDFIGPTVTPVPTPACEVPFEICVAAQRDTTLGVDGYEKIQRFIRKTIQAGDAISPQLSIKWAGVAIGAGISQMADHPFREKGSEVTAFFAKIGPAVVPGAFLDKGLRTCRNLFNSEGDPGAARKVIVITDGKNTDSAGNPRSFSLFKQQADRLKEIGAEIWLLAAGVEPGGTAVKLQNMSGALNSNRQRYHKIFKFNKQQRFTNYAAKLATCPQR